MPEQFPGMTETDFQQMYQENPGLMEGPEQPHANQPDSWWRYWQGTSFDQMSREEIEAALIQAMKWNSLHGRWLLELRVAAQKILEPRYQKLRDDLPDRWFRKFARRITKGSKSHG